MSRAEVEIISLLLTFFNHDYDKVVAWMECENPHLGYITPNKMIKVGRSEKLLKFVKNCIEGDLP